MSITVPTITTGISANLSQGTESVPVHFAESETAIDPQNPNLAVTIFQDRMGAHLQEGICPTVQIALLSAQLGILKILILFQE